VEPQALALEEVAVQITLITEVVAVVVHLVVAVGRQARVGVAMALAAVLDIKITLQWFPATHTQLLSVAVELVDIVVKAAAGVVVVAQCVSFGPAVLVASHQRIQETYNA
jgi:hypothetical protein